MAKYPDKDEWIEEILIPDRATPILGGQPVWEGDRLVDGFANVPAGQLANRTRHLKNKVEQIEADIDGDSSPFIRKENNLSDLDDLQQAKYNLGLNLVDNTRDLDKPVSVPQQEALDNKVDRDDLANPDMGAAMVARGVVAVESYSALTQLPAGQRKPDLRYLVCGSVFRWDAVKSMFVAEGPITMRAFGAVADGIHPDNQAFADAAAYCGANKGISLDLEGRDYYLYDAREAFNVNDIRSFIVHGGNATIHLENPTQDGMRTVFNVTKVKYVKVTGVHFKISVIDNSTPVDPPINGSRSYAIRVARATAADPHVPHNDYCEISGCIFEDLVGIPNTSPTRPFSGSLNVAQSNYVRIFDNQFINGCGRVCYVNDSYNVSIRNNKFVNLNYVPTPVGTPLGTLSIRILSCIDVNITENTLEFAEANNHTILARGIYLGPSSQKPDVPTSNVRVSGNTFIANKDIDRLRLIGLDMVDTIKINDNVFYGNSAKSNSVYAIFAPFDSQVSNVEIFGNSFFDAYPEFVRLAPDAEKHNVSANGNYLYFEGSIKTPVLRLTRMEKNAFGNYAFVDGDLIDSYSGLGQVEIGRASCRDRGYTARE